LVGRMPGIDLRVTPIALDDTQCGMGYDKPKAKKTSKKNEGSSSITRSPIFFNLFFIIHCTSAFKDLDI
jgi:hypothetical protein